MTALNRSAPMLGTEAATGVEHSDGLAHRLRSNGAGYDAAVRDLHALMLRAAWHQVSHTPGAYERLGAARVDEVVVAAADEATVAVLWKLDSFQGRSRFSTWAYKFGILHTAVELRRASWRHVDLDLSALGERISTMPSPPQHAEARDLAGAIRHAMNDVLTAHQRAVAAALLIEGVPIDVLAERLGSTRNALYKTLHDARTRLRAELARCGYLTDPAIAEEVTR